MEDVVGHGVGVVDQVGVVQQAAERALGAAAQQVREGGAHHAVVPPGAQELHIVGFAADHVDIVVEPFLDVVIVPLLYDWRHVVCGCRYAAGDPLVLNVSVTAQMLISTLGSDQSR